MTQMSLDRFLRRHEKDLAIKAIRACGTVTRDERRSLVRNRTRANIFAIADRHGIDLTCLNPNHSPPPAQGTKTAMLDPAPNGKPRRIVAKFGQVIRIYEVLKARLNRTADGCEWIDPDDTDGRIARELTASLGTEISTSSVMHTRLQEFGKLREKRGPLQKLTKEALVERLALLEQRVAVLETFRSEFN